MLFVSLFPEASCCFLVLSLGFCLLAGDDCWGFSVCLCGYLGDLLVCLVELEALSAGGADHVEGAFLVVVVGDVVAVAFGAFDEVVASVLVFDFVFCPG